MAARAAAELGAAADGGRDAGFSGFNGSEARWNARDLARDPGRLGELLTQIRAVNQSRQPTVSNSVLRLSAGVCRTTGREQRWLDGAPSGA